MLINPLSVDSSSCRSFRILTAGSSISCEQTGPLTPRLQYMTFSFSWRCWATRWISLWRHHIYRSLANWANCTDIVLPCCLHMILVWCCPSTVEWLYSLCIWHNTELLARLPTILGSLCARIVPVWTKDLRFEHLCKFPPIPSGRHLSPWTLWACVLKCSYYSTKDVWSTTPVLFSLAVAVDTGLHNPDFPDLGLCWGPSATICKQGHWRNGLCGCWIEIAPVLLWVKAFEISGHPAWSFWLGLLEVSALLSLNPEWTQETPTVLLVSTLIFCNWWCSLGSRVDTLNTEQSPLFVLPIQPLPVWRLYRQPSEDPTLWEGSLLDVGSW